METGWISLHRKIQEHWIWDDPVYFKAWITILMQVNHQDNKILIKSKLIECNRGQSLLSLENWTKLFGKGWTKQKTRTFFDLLKKDSMIITENMKKTTRLTICNYDKYQNLQHADNTHVTRTQHARNTHVTSNNNDNKDLIMINNENNFFKNEKTDLLFKRFLEERKINSKVRQESLLTLLKTLSEGNDDYARLIINKAIAGGYESFVGLTTREKEQFETDSYLPSNYSIKINKNPSLDDFIQFFEENEQSRDLAERVYYDFEYNKHWIDKTGNSFADNWQEIVKQNIFKKNGSTS